MSRLTRSLAFVGILVCAFVVTAGAIALASSTAEPVGNEAKPGAAVRLDPPSLLEQCDLIPAERSGGILVFDHAEQAPIPIDAYEYCAMKAKATPDLEKLNAAGIFVTYTLENDAIVVHYRTVASVDDKGLTVLSDPLPEGEAHALLANLGIAVPQEG
jgi:hypothetical protein